MGLHLSRVDEGKGPTPKQHISAEQSVQDANRTDANPTPLTGSSSHLQGPEVLANAKDVTFNGGIVEVIGRDKLEYHVHLNEAHNAGLVSKIQDWLAPTVNYRSIQIDTFMKRTAGTGSWFLEGEPFQRWLRSNGGVLWATGMPGAGKTVLASAVVDYLQQLARNAKPGTVSIAFAYARYTDPIPIIEILSALIKQLLEDDPRLVQLIEPLYTYHQQRKTQPSQTELVDLLIQISKVSERIFFVLDGLDEAPDDVQFDLINILSSLPAHFIITSRPLKSLEAELPNAVFLNIAAQKEDIRLHVRKIINRKPDLRRLLEQNGFKENIISGICDKAQGMFLHAILQVEMLQSCMTVKRIREALEAFPIKLEEMYAISLTRIGAQSPERASLAKRILLWLVFATSALTVEELQYAACGSLDTHTFDPEDIVDEVLLVSVCCGLVTVDSESRLVRLIHFTAKDALPSALLNDFPDPHGFLATTCVSRLISCQFPQSGFENIFELLDAFVEHPFLRHAYDSWHLHAKKCDPSSTSPAAQHIASFLQACQSFPITPEFYGRLGDFDRANSIQVAAYYGLVHLIKYLGVDCNTATPIAKATPLILALASYRGDPESRSDCTRSAMLLLDSPGIQVNSAASNGFTALIQAAAAGFEDVVSRLLQFPEIGINISESVGNTALAVASQIGHSGIINLLLGHGGVDVNATDADQGRRQTPLIYACLRGDVDVVKRLLEHNEVDVNVTDMEGLSALMYASRRCDIGMLKLLLRHPRIDVNTAGFNEMTTLMYASQKGHDAVVELLLTHPGLEVNRHDREEWTALIYASETGHSSTLKLLLGHVCVDVNATDISGTTALMYASANGHNDAVRVLLRHPEIEVNRADEDGWTALMFASFRGKRRIVQQLLNFPGIDIDMRDHHGQTAQDLALIDSYVDIKEIIQAAKGL